MPNAPWQPMLQRVALLALSNEAIAARGSIALTTRRLLISVSLVTCAAFANASATFGGLAVEIVERDVAGHVVVKLRRAGLGGIARLGDGG